jgi:hypothetical protein
MAPYIVFLLFLPVTLGTIYSFTGRPDIPLGFNGGTLERKPEGSPLQQLYRWIERQTPANAVIICDPSEPVKMSGNVSELPAMTSRSLFIDQRSYMTSYYADESARDAIAREVANGQPLGLHELSYLRQLRRPLFAVTYHADDGALVDKLIKQNGDPLFREGFVAIFSVSEPLQPSVLTMAFSTYLGGSNFEHIRDVTTDSQGKVYVTGGTTSPDFPVTAGAFQTTHNPGTPDSPSIDHFDVFVTKLDASGRIIWSTFLGGPNYDRAYAIKVDNQGYVYVAGRAGRGFPVTAGAFQTSFQGGQSAAFYGPQDGFIAKLAPDGSRLIWASYFGTSDPSIIRDIALDQNGDVYLASGWAAGAYEPTVAAAFNNSPRGGADGVFAKIKGDGSRVLWATYLGGSDWESDQNSVRLDAAGNPYVLLTTRSTDIITTPGAYDRSFAGVEDLYVAKLAPSTGNLVWATYLGGPEDESTETHEFAVDPQGNVYVAAPTSSLTLPTTTGAFQRSYGGGGNDIYLAKISPDGSTLLAGTYIGGTGNDRAEGVAVDALGQVYFTGTTTSPNFPVTSDAFQSSLAGPRDAIAVMVSADFSQLLYSSYIGGSGEEYGRAACVDLAGNFYFGAETPSSNWPVLNAMQSVFGGGPADSTLSRLAPVAAAPAPVIARLAILGKNLFVYGENFQIGAVVELTGEDLNTRNQPDSAHELKCKKAGKRIPRGATVSLVARNPDGRKSPAFQFTRPND